MILARNTFCLDLTQTILLLPSRRTMAKNHLKRNRVCLINFPPLHIETHFLLARIDFWSLDSGKKLFANERARGLAEQWCQEKLLSNFQWEWDSLRKSQHYLIWITWFKRPLHAMFYLLNSSLLKCCLSALASQMATLFSGAGDDVWENRESVHAWVLLTLVFECELEQLSGRSRVQIFDKL